MLPTLLQLVLNIFSAFGFLRKTLLDPIIRHLNRVPAGTWELIMEAECRLG